MIISKEKLAQMTTASAKPFSSSGWYSNPKDIQENPANYFHMTKTIVLKNAQNLRPFIT